MKKTLKLILLALTFFIVLVGINPTISLAAKDDVNSTIDLLEQQETTTPSQITTIGGTIVNWLWSISIVVAVVVVMYIGLKFVIGSAEEKAEYKKSLMPFLVGVMVLVFATSIVKLVFSIKPDDSANDQTGTQVQQQN